MQRNILLIEPNYKNKYPPIGLMKIATYHRLLGDNVKFFKGDLRDLIVEQLYCSCLKKLKHVDRSIDWNDKAPLIKHFIKTKQLALLEPFAFERMKYGALAKNVLIEFSDIFRKREWKKKPKWDRVYVTTLFTFYWNVTIETIEFAKNLVKDIDELKVGGVMASLLHNEIYVETGIITHQGLLDQPGVLDPGNRKAKKIIIDDLPLDYSILDEIEYEYPTKSAYFTFMTKGCTRKCAFCSVPILEPTYKQKIETADKFAIIKRKFGEQQNLLLMDNNVLASPKFLEIIEEIKEMGFVKGATFVEPNQLDIVYKNIKSKDSSRNDYGYLRRYYKLTHDLIPRVKGDVKDELFRIIKKYSLHKVDDVTRKNAINSYRELQPIYEKYRNKSSKLRYVDFNQGTDARYVTEEIMKKMSEIPIRPLRIAFDYIGLKDQYSKAVKLAAKYGINELSNYILYNFHDKPEDLWNRLKINVDLSKELNIEIYSFPMKYIPLFGEDAKHREYTGKFWNKKYIRAIQSILNVTKGIVAPAKRTGEGNVSFFQKAFGKDINEFYEILYMPETYIVYRSFFEEMGMTQMWRKLFNSLSEDEKNIVLPIIRSNDFKNIDIVGDSNRVKELLRHYIINKDNLKEGDQDHKKLKGQYRDLIKKDDFINLTLTYDFEQLTPKKRKKVF